jgi:hypothetical protein
MMQIYLLFACGLTLSAIAAFYAITGLVAIFATAPLAIALMGSSLEVTKLVIASWLYNNWREIPKSFKAYFSVALVILMLLTSMGIFGYLSKAHLDQAVPTGDVVSKLAIVDEKIKQEKDIVDAARKTLQQLDAQVDQTVARSDSTQGVERSLQIRRGQQKERTTLLAEIGSAQTRIARLNEERAPIASEVRKVEAEVGPLKYIAALIYGTDTLDETILEKSVRIVIIMIVVVFDPLAVITLLAANYSLRRLRNDTRKETTDKGAGISDQEQSASEIPSKEYTFPSTLWFKTEEEITVPETPKPKARSKKSRATKEGDSGDGSSGWLESKRVKPKPLPTDFLTKVKEDVQPEVKPIKENTEVNGWQYTSYTKPEDPAWKEANPLNDPTDKASKG